MKAVSVGLSSMLLAFLAGGARADDQAYLGAFIQNVPEPLAAQLGVEGGVLVENVTPGSPAEKAKIERFDVIVAFGDAAVKGTEDLKAAIAARKPGDKVNLTVVRKGEKKTFEVELAARKEGDVKFHIEAKPARKGFLGVQLEPVPEVLVVQLKLGEGKGAMVTDALEDSAAKKAGIKRFDVIVAIDGKEVAGPEAVQALLGEKIEGQAVSIEVIQGGERKKIDVTLGGAPDEMKGMPYPPAKGPKSSITRWKGKIILRDDQGNEHVIEVPEVGVPDFDLELPKLPDFKQFQPHFDKEAIQKELREAQQRVKELLEKMKKAGEGAFHMGPRIESSTAFVYKYSDGEHDITVQGSGDSRRVTVEKGGKVIAEDLPWSDLDKLPEDVRAKVKGLQIEAHPMHGPVLEVVPSPAPEKKPLLPKRGMPI